MNEIQVYLDEVELDSNDMATRTVCRHVATESVAAELVPGTLAGEYRIEGELGKGGFGTVYRAIHPLIGKAVAIKVLNPYLAANREAVSRFVVEARAVNQIRHPNIVDIFSFGTLDDGRHYLAMEFLHGENLGDYLLRLGRIPPTQAVAILRPLARALDAAHRSGIAHRDLKPSNVFLVVDPDGQMFPKLIDFGVAKLLNPRTGDCDHRTGVGTPIGTPYYMSPEQCLGENIDHRADIYSLGVLVHEMLTGVRPFADESMAGVFAQHLEAEPRPMSNTCAGLPPSLDAPVLRMLAKNREDRPASAGEAIEALAKACTGLDPLPSDLPSRAPVLEKRTNRLARPRVALALAALVAVPALVWVGVRRSTEPGGASPQRATTGAGNVGPEINSPAAPDIRVATASNTDLVASRPASSGPDTPAKVRPTHKAQDVRRAEGAPRIVLDRRNPWAD